MTEKSATQTGSLPTAAPERSENDEMMDKLRPYLTKIGVAVVLGLLALIAITLLIDSRQQSSSAPWQELTTAQAEFSFSGNVDRLTQVASQYPNTKAAMHALQSAGDFQLRQGIDQLATDRDKGFGLIEKSKESYQQILDAPVSAKSSDIQQASVFAMAYANESLGQFDEAAKYYTQLIEEAPDSHFVSDAKRGVARSTNPDFVAAYKKFKDFEPLGDAPGPNVPTRPEIDFPEVQVPEDEPGTDEVMPDDSPTESGDEVKMEQPEVKPVTASTDEAAPADPAKLNPDEANSASEKTESVKPATEVVEPATEVVEPATEVVEPTATETVEPATPETIEVPVVPETPVVPDTPATPEIIDAVQEVVEPVVEGN